MNAAAVVAPDEVAGAGESGSADFDVTFGYTGDYIAQVHGLNGPGLTLGIVEDDPGNSFQFLGPGTVIGFLEEIPDGTAFARWAIFDEYTSGNDDIDLYLYYCPELSCTQIDLSGNSGSNEEVSVTFPLNDPNIDDPYLVFLHGFETEGGLPATVVQFDWSFGVVDDAGNLTVTAPGNAASPSRRSGRRSRPCCAAPMLRGRSNPARRSRRRTCTSPCPARTVSSRAANSVPAPCPMPLSTRTGL